MSKTSLSKLTRAFRNVNCLPRNRSRIHPGISIKQLFENFDGEIPQPIKDLVEFMKKNSINLEGLLRQNGSVKITDNLLTSIIDAKEYDLSKINDEHVVGSVFKRLFRDTISDSLIPDSLIQEFFDIQNEKNELNKLTSIQNLLRKLPEENYSLLKYIVSFLSDVAARSSCLFEMVGTINYGFSMRHKDPQRIKKQLRIGMSIKELYKVNSGEFPTFLKQLITCIKHYGLEQENIMSEPGLLDDVNKLVSMIENDDDFELDDGDVYVAGSVLKKIFRSMNDNLIQDIDSFLNLADCQETKQKYEKTLKILNHLPNENYELLMNIIELLVEIANNSTKNKMTVRNLARCTCLSFLPNIQIPNNSNCTKDTFTRLACGEKMLAYLIENYYNLFSKRAEA